MSAPMTLAEALVRLQQYGERTSTWSTATYDSGAEKALHQIAVTLVAEVSRLSDDLTGANLALSEEEQDVKRARFAAQLARKRAFDLRSERDAFADWADTLAYKVAPVEVLGRYGEEGKYPWGDALELITPAAEVEVLRGRVAELEAQAEKVSAFCAQRAEYVSSLRNCHPDNGHDYDRWQGHAAARRQLSQALGLPVGWPAEDKQSAPPAPVEDPHDSPLHHTYALGRDLPGVTP